MYCWNETVVTITIGGLYLTFRVKHW